MQIDRIYYPVETLGPGKRIVIWTIGCDRECYNCSNPELWNTKADKDISIDNIMSMIECIDKPDGITITGGEPFLQVEDLYDLINRIEDYGIDDILIYSGYTLSELKEMNDIKVNYVLESIAVLIDGAYIDSLNDNRGIRGSSNQKINILKKKYRGRYIDCDKGERKSQIVISDNLVMSFGVPRK